MFPDFNRLKVFYYIHLRKSVASAARELCLTQSAISQHLKKLETELKTPLFTRLHKRLVPTQAGGRLYDIMAPFMGSLENGIRNMQSGRQGPFGPLRIGAPVVFGSGHLPEIFASFRGKYPEVVFHFTLGYQTALLSLVSEGKLDFALVDIFSRKEEVSKALGMFCIEPLVNEELVLVCSRKYFADRLKGDTSLKSLLNGDYISYQKDVPDLKGWFRHHYNKFPPGFNVVLTVESIPSVISAIQNHMGLGIVPSHLVYGEISSGRMVRIKTSKREIMNRISLVQLQDKVPTLTERAFITHLKHELSLVKMLKEP